MKRRPVLTRNQFKRIANILDNIGQVIIASVVIPSIFGVSLDSISPKLLALLGIIATLIVWWFSLKLEGISS